MTLAALALALATAAVAAPAQTAGGAPTGAGAGAGGEGTAAPPPPPGGVARRGELLFSGRSRFQNGGPPCGACHPAAGLPFPGGGTIGPDLTGAYQKFGPEPLGVALSTLFFPTMNPVFAGRPLTPAERADLVAFLAESGTLPPSSPGTLRTVLSGLAVLAAVAAVMGVLGRRRLRGVRAPLVARARRREAGRP